jgi:CDP-diacylglycerol---glycerol-3-phosphate 3-phosphatidyltransferase
MTLREPHKPSFREASKDALFLILRPLVRWLSIMRVRPDTLTVIGWTLALVSAVLFGMGYARIAGESNTMSSFGAFLDSTLDRLSESAIFVGLIFFYASTAHPYGALLAGIAMTFSLLTSYARARAEGLDIDCKVGLLERAGRVVILSVFSIAGLPTVGLGLLAAGALITTAQRILHVRRATRG